MESMSRTLLLRLRAELKRVAQPEKAAAMQRYMKSTLPYYGAPAPIARHVFRKIFSTIQFRDGEEWRSAVLYIWRNAKFREEWYAAIALCEVRQAKDFQSPSTLSMFEEMIVTGAWWDVVDPLAAHGVGSLLRRYPRPISAKMRSWSRSDDLWKRRTSIICQLGFKDSTDLQLLYACIEPSLKSKEFFIRKAIGWALRQYAWTNPGEVRRYVREHQNSLSPLSRREALKNLSS